MKHAYYPSRTFDDDLIALANLCADKGLAIVGIDGARLQKDADEQRRQRAELDALKGKLAELDKTFLAAQHERYDRYATVLQAARVAFRKDAAMTAVLRKFRRDMNRSTPAAEAPPSSQNNIS